MYFILIIQIVSVIVFLLTPANGKEVSYCLTSGTRVTLEPNSASASVSVHFLLDKTLFAAEKNGLIFSEIFIQALSRKCQTLPGVTKTFPARQFPEVPYNWAEQGIILLKMRSDEFIHHAPEIVAIFNDARKISSNNSFNLNIHENLMNADSLLWSDTTFAILKNYKTNRGNRFRNEWREFLDTGKVYRSLYVRISGNFNLLDVLLALKPFLAQDETSSNAPLAVGNDTPPVAHSVRTMSSDGLYCLFETGRVTPEKVLILTYLTDHLKIFFAEQIPNSRLRINYPWSSGSARFSIHLEFRHNDFTDLQRLRYFLVQLHALPELQIKNWYFSNYLKRISAIYHDDDQRLLYRQLGLLYFADSDALFRVFTEDGFPQDHLQQCLTQILEQLISDLEGMK